MPRAATNEVQLSILPRRQASASAAPMIERPEAAAAEPAPAAPPRAPRASEGLRHPGRPGVFGRFGFALLCVAAATLVRWGLSLAGVHGLTPFATYYPAALLALLGGGAGPGVLAAVLGGAIACWAFGPEELAFNLRWPADALNLALYLGATGLMIWTLDRRRRIVRRLMAEEARLVILAGEQRHRVQNAVAVVESIVRQSLRDAPERAQVINHRIRAGLADIDIRPPETGAPRSLHALLGDELRGFDLARISLQGRDDTPLPPAHGDVISLAVHELAINALKYGALSSPDGEVLVDWKLADGRVRLCWRERGGPPVEPPREHGFGVAMLHRLVEANQGSLEIDFWPTGLVAELSLPLAPARRGLGRRPG